MVNLFFIFLMITTSLRGQDCECVRFRKLAKYKNVDKVGIPDNYLNFSGETKIVHPLIDAKIDTADMVVIPNPSVLFDFIYDKYTSLNLKTSDSLKHDTKISFMGNVTFITQIQTRLFLLDKGSGKEFDSRTVLMINSKGNKLISYAILSVYSHYMMMNTHMTSELSSSGFYIRDISTSDFLVSEEQMKNLPNKIRKIREYGYCINLKIKENGLLKTSR